MNRMARVAFFLFAVASMIPGFVYADSARAEANVLGNQVCLAEPPAEISNIYILATVNPLCTSCDAQGCCRRCVYRPIEGCVCSGPYICA